MPIQRAVILGVLLSFSAFAATWSGALVDAKCYRSQSTNVNPREPAVSRDVNAPIRYCAPTAKTKGFAIVLKDASSLNLDQAAYSKAAELVSKAGKQDIYPVTITGEKNRKTIKVDSIALSQ